MVEQKREAASPGGGPDLIAGIAAAVACRILLNTARRFLYPFAPVLSRGLGVPLTAITSLIAVNQATGIMGPLFGPLADRWGYRRMLVAGMGILAVGMLAGGILPLYGIVVLSLFMAGLGKNIFDPAIQAYAGTRVPFHRRGAVIGIMETSWAGSTLIGIPLIGFLMEAEGWRSPFFALGSLSLVGMVLIARLIPRDPTGRGRSGPPLTVWQAWRMLGGERAALGLMGFAFFVSAANDNFFVVYGAWLESAFGLSIVTLGVTAMVIGVGELLGEGITATLSDRLGLRRSATIGLVLSGISYGVLPSMGGTLPMALVSLFVVFLTVEFAIVTALSLSTEVLPGARATMMSGYVGAAGLGRIFGALSGGPVWLLGGIDAIAVVSVVLTGMALLCLRLGLRGWPR
ncbi:MAG: MFS transporter [Deltaproteobacteria bacterium]|nr:MFS transporter [Deltaproteobacteria bacterium]